MRLNIAVDDVHPELGWGLPGDQSMKYLTDLHDEFGVMYTLFIPSNYHRKYPIGEYKDWIQWLKTHTYFELAAHGHYHDTEDPRRWGECEFGEITNVDVCRERLHLIREEWNKAGHVPVGWRSPGWLCQAVNAGEIGRLFSYAALHYEHNRNLHWVCKEFYGHDGINISEIGVHNGDMIMYQSHINGTWNDNMWCDANYEQMRVSLRFLLEQYPDLQFCTLNMCL